MKKTSSIERSEDTIVTEYTEDVITEEREALVLEAALEQEQDVVLGRLLNTIEDKHREMYLLRKELIERGSSTRMVKGSSFSDFETDRSGYVEESDEIAERENSSEQSGHETPLFRIDVVGVEDEKLVLYNLLRVENLNLKTDIEVLQNEIFIANQRLISKKKRGPVSKYGKQNLSGRHSVAAPRTKPGF